MLEEVEAEEKQDRIGITVILFYLKLRLRFLTEVDDKNMFDT